MRNNINKNILNIFYLFCVLGVIAIHTRAFSGINGYVEWAVRENITRIIVPVIFLMASSYFYENNGIMSKIKISRFIVFLLKSILVYLLFTVIWILSQILVIGVEVYDWRELFRILLNGGAPCAWMILSYAIGIFLIVIFRKLGVSLLKLTLLSLLLYIVSISTELYFHLVFKSAFMRNIYRQYSYYFLTTRNGLFYGFFWCALGVTLSSINIFQKKNVKKKTLTCAFIFVILMVVEHYVAFLNNWPKDYKSSFMLIPASVSIFIFLKAGSYKYEVTRNDLFFRNWMFVAFMLLPSVALVVKGIVNNNSLYEFYIVTIVSLGCSCLFVRILPGLKFNLFA